METLFFPLVVRFLLFSRDILCQKLYFDTDFSLYNTGYYKFHFYTEYVLGRTIVP